MTELSRRTRIAAWVGAGVLGGLAAGIAVAQIGVAGADPTPSPSSSARPDRPYPGPMMGPGFGMGFGMGGRMLHGEATIKTPGGDLKDIATQYGSITAIGGSTVTVRSSDGFTRDYTVDNATRIALNGKDGALSSLKTGDTVRVMAVKDGSAWHAQVVMHGRPPHPAFGMMGRFGPRAAHQQRYWNDAPHMPMMRPPASSG